MKFRGCLLFIAVLNICTLAHLCNVIVTSFDVAGNAHVLITNGHFPTVQGACTNKLGVDYLAQFFNGRAPRAVYMPRTGNYVVAVDSLAYVAGPILGGGWAWVDMPGTQHGTANSPFPGISAFYDAGRSNRVLNKDTLLDPAQFTLLSPPDIPAGLFKDDAAVTAINDISPVTSYLTSAVQTLYAITDFRYKLASAVVPGGGFLTQNTMASHLNSVFVYMENGDFANAAAMMDQLLQQLSKLHPAKYLGGGGIYVPVNSHDALVDIVGAIEKEARMFTPPGVVSLFHDLLYMSNIEDHQIQLQGGLFSNYRLSRDSMGFKAECPALSRLNDPARIITLTDALKACLGGYRYNNEIVRNFAEFSAYFIVQIPRNSRYGPLTNPFEFEQSLVIKRRQYEIVGFTTVMEAVHTTYVLKQTPGQPDVWYSLSSGVKTVLPRPPFVNGSIRGNNIASVVYRVCGVPDDNKNWAARNVPQEHSNPSVVSQSSTILLTSFDPASKDAYSLTFLGEFPKAPGLVGYNVGRAVLQALLGSVPRAIYESRTGSQIIVVNSMDYDARPLGNGWAWLKMPSSDALSAASTFPAVRKFYASPANRLLTADMLLDGDEYVLLDPMLPPASLIRDNAPVTGLADVSQELASLTSAIQLLYAIPEFRSSLAEIVRTGPMDVTTFSSMLNSLFIHLERGDGQKATALLNQISVDAFKEAHPHMAIVSIVKKIDMEILAMDTLHKAGAPRYFRNLLFTSNTETRFEGGGFSKYSKVNVGFEADCSELSALNHETNVITVTDAFNTCVNQRNAVTAPPYLFFSISREIDGVALINPFRFPASLNNMAGGNYELVGFTRKIGTGQTTYVLKESNTVGQPGVWHSLSNGADTELAQSPTSPAGYVEGTDLFVALYRMTGLGKTLKICAARNPPTEHANPTLPVDNSNGGDGNADGGSAGNTGGSTSSSSNSSGSSSRSSSSSDDESKGNNDDSKSSKSKSPLTKLSTPPRKAGAVESHAFSYLTLTFTSFLAFYLL